MRASSVVASAIVCRSEMTKMEAAANASCFSRRGASTPLTSVMLGCLRLPCYLKSLILLEPISAGTAKPALPRERGWRVEDLVWLGNENDEIRPHCPALSTSSRCRTAGAQSDAARGTAGALGTRVFFVCCARGLRPQGFRRVAASLRVRLPFFAPGVRAVSLEHSKAAELGS